MAYVPTKSKTVDRVSEWRIKEQICDIGRRIWLKGFCAGNEGNHSYRIGENRILCTPSLISKGNLKPDDVCAVNMEGKQIAGRLPRTSEILLHLAIYKNRPDIKAVIHSHPPHATAFAVAGIDLPTCIHPEAEVFLGVVRTAKYVTPGDTRLGNSVIPLLPGANTILLESHGAVCFGPDLEQTYYRLEIVNAYARILLLAKQVGSIRPLTGGEMKELLDLKARFGMTDLRVSTPADKLNCAGDFLARVGSEIGTRGRMVCAQGTVPVVTQSVASASPPPTEDDLEQLVQTITDQIMAANT